MTALAAVSTPCTQTVVEFLATLRRHLRFNDTLDKYVNEVIRFAVRALRLRVSSRIPLRDCLLVIPREARGAPHHFCLRLFERMKDGRIGGSASPRTPSMRFRTLASRGATSRPSIRTGGVKVPSPNSTCLRMPASSTTAGEARFEIGLARFRNLKPADTRRQYFFNLIQNMGWTLLIFWSLKWRLSHGRSRARLLLCRRAQGRPLQGDEETPAGMGG